MLRLVNVYTRKDAVSVLYALLKEREARMNISHRRMPTLSEHARFVRLKPYKTWDLILSGDEIMGAVYLSKQNEIGLFIFRKYRGCGIGKKALELLMKKHKKVTRFLANINPKNRPSIDFFKNQGFFHIQNTYELHKKRGGA